MGGSVLSNKELLVCDEIGCLKSMDLESLNGEILGNGGACADNKSYMVVSTTVQALDQVKLRRIVTSCAMGGSLNTRQDDTPEVHLFAPTWQTTNKVAKLQWSQY